MRQRHARRSGSRSLGVLPYRATVLYSQDFELRHRPERIEQLSERNIRACCEFRDALQEPERRAYGRVGCERQMSQAGSSASEKCFRKLDGRAAVDDGETEILDWGWAAQAIEEVEDIDAETDETEGAYPRCGKEQL